MKYNYLVTNPDGKSRIKAADNRFHAIAMCVVLDNYKWSNSKYIVKKTK